MECPPECCLACDHDYEDVECICGADEPKKTARQRGAAVAETCKLVAPGLTWDVVQTSDGGVTVDTETDAGERDLLFAVPEEAGILYFTARGPGLRRAGIVMDDVAILELARWVSTGADFPVDGLLLG